MRTPRVDKNGLKQGSWSAEEDQKLIDYITRYRIWNWSLMPKFAGLSRNGKSCRLRWVNYLNPNIRRGNITKEEEQIIIDSYVKFGSRWSKIVTRLPGRTDNEIKNYWHTHLKKLFKEEPMAKMKSIATKISKVEASLGISDGSNNRIPAGASQGFHNPGMTPLTDLGISATIGDFHSLWAQTFFDENYHMDPERQEPYIQEWYQEEPLSPNNGFYNNEYWLNDFPVMDGAEQRNAYFM